MILGFISNFMKFPDLEDAFLDFCLTDKEKFKLVFEHPFSLGKYARSAFRKRRDKLYKSDR